MLLLGSLTTLRSRTQDREHWGSPSSIHGQSMYVLHGKLDFQFVARVARS